MGSSMYSSDNRSMRATSLGYHHKQMEEIFSQMKEHKIHESMEPRLARMRESRDSVNHPLSCPIILDLDVTGSMRKIPHFLIKDGLPNTIEGIMKAGIADPQILFTATGDHVYDRAPFQVGQFESGDAELDMWLQRCWPEGGGGSNEGESYMLGWWFAAHRTVTDAWEKRGQKGLYISIGDEPVIARLSAREINRIFDEPQAQDWNSADLLREAEKKYRVIRLQMLQGYAGESSAEGWNRLLGQNCIKVEKQEDVPSIIASLAAEHFQSVVSTISAAEKPAGDEGETKITL